MIQILILILALICSYGAIRSKGLISAALWLAGTSAMVSLTIYLMGAPELAVMELSIGAGLVTVLFVFAISIISEEEFINTRFLPRPFAVFLIILFVGLLGWFALAKIPIETDISAVENLSTMIWENRSLDIFIQVIMIFAGVLGFLGLLAESKQMKHSSKKS